MKLSIIVPVYNMAANQQLEYCLNSLVQQDLSDFEIIAVDDASTDNSYEILMQYEEKYGEFFKTIHLNENCKQGGAKNKGLDFAKGDYIGFVDSDDWIAEDMYKKLLKRAIETDADMVGCDYNLTTKHSMEIGKIIKCNKNEQVGILNKVKCRSLLLDFGSLVIKIYKKEVFEKPKLRFPEHIFYEDNAISSMIVMRIKKFEYIEEPLYYYLQYPQSTVHVITKERCENRMQAMRVMVNHMKMDGYFEEYKDEIEYKYINLFYENTLFSYLQSAKHKKINFLKKMIREVVITFPEFRKNKYYLERTSKEHKKYINAHCKSTLYMLATYSIRMYLRKLKLKHKK